MGNSNSTLMENNKNLLVKNKDLSRQLANCKINYLFCEKMLQFKPIPQVTHRKSLTPTHRKSLTPSEPPPRELPQGGKSRRHKRKKRTRRQM